MYRYRVELEKASSHIVWVDAETGEEAMRVAESEVRDGRGYLVDEYVRARNARATQDLEVEV